MMELTQGNISTIATYIYWIISPILIKYGIDIDEATGTTFIVAIIGLCLTLWSSYNPNTLKVLGNQPTTLPETKDYQPTILNQEYTTEDTAGDQEDGC